jgi:chromosome segregation ATPase
VTVKPKLNSGDISDIKKSISVQIHEKIQQSLAAINSNKSRIFQFENEIDVLNELKRNLASQIANLHSSNNARLSQIESDITSEKIRQEETKTTLLQLQSHITDQKTLLSTHSLSHTDLTLTLSLSLSQLSSANTLNQQESLKFQQISTTNSQLRSNILLTQQKILTLKSQPTQFDSKFLAQNELQAKNRSKKFDIEEFRRISKSWSKNLERNMLMIKSLQEKYGLVQTRLGCFEQELAGKEEA